MNKDNNNTTVAQIKAELNVVTKPIKKNNRIKPKTKPNPENNPAQKQPVKAGNSPAKKPFSNAQKKTPVKIIPLGGLNEIGKNFTCIECANDIFIVDCGLAFPDRITSYNVCYTKLLRMVFMSVSNNHTTNFLFISFSVSEIRNN